jgi:hypothetical protein
MDGGLAWMEVALHISEADKYLGCGTPRLLGNRGRLWALMHAGQSWYWSIDGGQHWEALPLPDGQPVQQLIPSPRFSEQPILIATSPDGRLWTMRLD